MILLDLGISVTTDDPEAMTRAIDVFTRAALGVAMDGVEVTVNVGPHVDEDEPARDDEA